MNPQEASSSAGENFGAGGNAAQRQPDPVSQEAQVLMHMILIIARRAREMVLWAFAGAVATAVILLSTDRVYETRVGLLSSSGDSPSLSGLRGLAGQFGVAIPSASGAAVQSPAFVSQLLNSEGFLRKVVAESIQAEGDSGVAVQAVWAELDVEAEPAATLASRSVTELRNRMRVDQSKESGVITLTMSGRSPASAVTLTNVVTAELRKYLSSLQREQASLERRFVESRLEVQRVELEHAERDLADFIRRNRDFAMSPDLRFEQERLRRIVDLRSGTLMSLAQSREETLMREVRENPGITIVEPPVVPERPVSRRLVQRSLIAAAVAAVLFAFIVSIDEMVRSVPPQSPLGEFLKTLSRFLLWRDRRSGKIKREEKL